MSEFKSIISMKFYKVIQEHGHCGEERIIGYYQHKENAEEVCNKQNKNNWKGYNKTIKMSNEVHHDSYLQSKCLYENGFLSEKPIEPVTTPPMEFSEFLNHPKRFHLFVVVEMETVD